MSTKWDKRRENIGIGLLIRNFRESKGHNQIHVVRNTNIAQSILSQYESGKLALTALDAITLFDFYEIDIRRIKEYKLRVLSTCS